METSTGTIEDVAIDDVEATTAHDDRREPTAGPVEIVEVLESRDVSYEVLGERAVRVVVPSGDVVMGAVPFLSEATSAVAILAEGRDDSSAVLMRDGQDLFVVRRDPGVWEHFRSMGGPSAVVGSWRSGQRTRFRQRHGALWQAIPPALTLADTLGIGDLMPQETPPPPPVVPEKKTVTPVRRAAAPKKPKAEKKVAQPEPAPLVCPRCFVQLPASGRCDCS